MRVAFTSQTGTHVDQHYGQAQAFFVWEIGPDEAVCVDRIVPPEQSETADLEATLSARADAIADCAILCTTQIGGPAAAKLVGRHVHPMKTTAVVPVADLVRQLQGVLRERPPPWLSKLATSTAARHDEDRPAAPQPPSKEPI